MPLRFPYVREATARPAVTLGRVSWRPRPVVPVGLFGPTTSWAVDAYLDTMADDCVFPDQLAAQVGIDLSALATSTLTAITRQATVVRYAQVRLRLSDGRESREWPAWVGFTSASLRRPLLCFAGCLQFFTATFHGDREEVELEANPLYPGT